MIQNFYFTFFLFLFLQCNFFPLWLCHQTSAIYEAPRFTGHPEKEMQVHITKAKTVFANLRDVEKQHS